MALSLQAVSLRPAGFRLQARSAGAKRPARTMAARAALSTDALQQEAVKAFLGDVKVTFAPTSGGAYASAASRMSFARGSVASDWCALQA
jgi:hypothetical protein